MIPPPIFVCFEKVGDTWFCMIEQELLMFSKTSIINNPPSNTKSFKDETGYKQINTCKFTNLSFIMKNLWIERGEKKFSFLTSSSPYLIL